MENAKASHMTTDRWCLFSSRRSKGILLANIDKQRVMGVEVFPQCWVEGKGQNEYSNTSTLYMMGEEHFIKNAQF